MSEAAFWTLTLFLGAGTFLIRFSFLGFLGRRILPGWLLLHLRFVGVAVFPALVAPMILWPTATGGSLDPLRAIAAAAALFAGLRFGVVAAILSGMGSLWLLQSLTG
ncbi:MAG: AzlD domain-containing protein [Gemmobacter sp.]